MPSFWELLGIEPTVERKEIEEAYLRQKEQLNPKTDQVALQRLETAYQTALSWQALQPVRGEVAHLSSSMSPISTTARREIFSTQQIEEETSQRLETFMQLSSVLAAVRLKKEAQYLKKTEIDSQKEKRELLIRASQVVNEGNLKQFQQVLEEAKRRGYLSDVGFQATFASLVKQQDYSSSELRKILQIARTYQLISFIHVIEETLFEKESSQRIREELDKNTSKFSLRFVYYFALILILIIFFFVYLSHANSTKTTPTISSIPSEDLRTQITQQSINEVMENIEDLYTLSDTKKVEYSMTEDAYYIVDSSSGSRVLLEGVTDVYVLDLEENGETKKAVAATKDGENWELLTETGESRGSIVETDPISYSTKIVVENELIQTIEKNEE